MYGTLISSVTVGAGGASNITFTGIPQTYTDLIVVFSGRSSAASVSPGMAIKLNASTGYNAKELTGNGSSTFSYSQSAASFMFPSGGMPGSSATANTFGNAILTIPNYTGSANKSVSIDSVSENNATEAWQSIYAGLWTNTAAVTEILLQSNGGTLVQYSTAYLYGLTKGSGGATAS